MTHLRSLAITAGLLYLVTHVSSVSAVVLYRAGYAEPSVNMLLGGATLEIVLALACVTNGVVLLVALRPFGPASAYTFAGLRLLEGAIIGAGVLPVLAVVYAARGGVPGMGIPIKELGSAEGVLWALHEASFIVGQGLVISINTVVISWLLWRAKAVYRGIPLLGALGALIVVISNTAQLLGLVEQSNPLVGLAAIPIFGFELWFAGYLLFVGFRPSVDSESPSPATPINMRNGERGIAKRSGTSDHNSHLQQGGGHNLPI